MAPMPEVETSGATPSAERVRARGHARHVDLFDDPPWPTALPPVEPVARSPRPWLLASLAWLALFLGSMALPWFGGTWTPGWPPLSPRLDGGGLPGTRAWGILMVVLAGITIATASMAFVSRRRAWVIASLVAGATLVAAIAPETLARVPDGDGPGLPADYGAWAGLAAAVLAWLCVAVAAPLAWRYAALHRRS